MVGYINIWYKDKRNFENHIFSDERFSEAQGRIDIRLKKKYYPIEVQYEGMNYKLDKYRGYISGYLPYFHWKSTNSKYIKNLNYQELSETIDVIEGTTVDIEKVNLSKLHFELTITPFLQASQIIEDNILMLKLKGFNQDKLDTSNKELKQFQHTDFTFGVYANKNGEGYFNTLSFVLKFTKSVKLRRIGIRNILDLKDKTKLRMLYDEFMKRFDELTIVDSFDSYNQFSSKDEKSMLLYMNINYWKGFSQTPAGRKEKSRARKNFEHLQRKYNLNTIMHEVRMLIEIEFERLINN